MSDIQITPEQQAARLDQLKRDLAMDFRTPAKVLMEAAAVDLGITVSQLRTRLSRTVKPLALPF